MRSKRELIRLYGWENAERITAYAKAIERGQDRDAAYYTARTRTKIKKWIRTAAFYILLFVTLTTSSRIEAHAAGKPKTNKQLIREYVRKTYGPEYKIIIRDGGTIDKQLTKRRGKMKIYVEKFQTRSTGENGIITKGPQAGKVAGYAARQKRGRKVTTYIIYTPKSNSLEGIAAIITRGKIKK